MSRDDALDRRAFLRGAATVGALAALGPSLWANGASRPTPPNFVHLMTDDQGWTDVGYMGYRKIRTPHMDAMSAAGLTLTRYYAPSAVCTPTRVSIPMGRHCTRYGRVTVGPCDVPPFDKPKQIPGPKDNFTLAQALKKRGYTTAHFGKSHGADLAAMDYKSAYGNATSPDPDLESRKKSLAFIKHAVADRKPFYLQLWTSVPHKKYTPKKEHLARYGTEAPAAYWAEISLADDILGAVRQQLRELGIADDTLVWFASDNGGHGVHQKGVLRDGKGSLYEGGVRVPGIIEFPRLIEKPARTDVPTSGLDVFPTFLELAGVKPPDYELDGLSLAPLLAGEMKARPKKIPFWFVDNSKQKTPHFALIDNRYKLLSYLTDDGRDELYDIPADMTESKNLAAAKPHVTKAMRDELAAWKKSVEASMQGGP
jgi:arylsulfatase A-like enzyme